MKCPVCPWRFVRTIKDIFPECRRIDEQLPHWYKEGTSPLNIKGLPRKTACFFDRILCCLPAFYLKFDLNFFLKNKALSLSIKAD
ncbi:MAG: hypothetical protein KKE44_19070 [Proteobacteria bacterium]|nr:hypothetical protein [Pseudomonadota bacterium]MBU1584837.1 hypothetical protein [Pseudomonadota bacterium]MBU2452554.1 hypothetical protein [Pseudomonadota bacterium]